ncbi:MAG: radical SAM family heme chaperone HemW [Flavobacteriaceae bacterium]|nr:radical SAM family heme chaperone HemW [Flavobacteriaceae bacterium]
MSGIYLHIPFCKQACSYCDFHFSTLLKKKEEFINAITKELILRKREINEQVETIYFGGGTPSLLTNEEIKHLISTVYSNYSVITNPEITLEANPDDLTKEKIVTLAKTKINRLSIGIQSFFNEDLQFMKRAHNAAEAIKTITIAVGIFDNITIDLIYGTPTLSNKNWKKNIEIALDLGINHISSYALTVESKTLLEQQINSNKIKPLNEKKAAEQFYILKEILEKNKFIHYEISNFAKEGYFSKHNTSYWLGKKYLGFGPSAHSFTGKQRSWNVANNAKYIKILTTNKLPSQTENLSQNNLFNETIMIGLRTIWGVSLSKIESNFGKNRLDFLLKKAQKHIDNKTLKISTNKLVATKKGKFLIDGITSDLFKVDEVKL